MVEFVSQDKMCFAKLYAAARVVEPTEQADVTAVVANDVFKSLLQDLAAMGPHTYKAATEDLISLDGRLVVVRNPALASGGAFVTPKANVEVRIRYVPKTVLAEVADYSAVDENRAVSVKG